MPIKRKMDKIYEILTERRVVGFENDLDPTMADIVTWLDQTDRALRVVLNIIEPPPYGDMLNFGGDPVDILDNWARKNWQAINDIAKILEEEN